MRVEPLEPRQIRYPKGAYGWVELKIVTEGYLQELDSISALIYLFLCTVGNREGVSFWNRSRIARTLNQSLEMVEAALLNLSSAGLIAATERVVQVLPVPIRSATQPTAPQPTIPQTNTLTPASMQLHREVSEQEILDHEAEARARIARFYGTRKASSSVVRALARSLALKDTEKDVHESAS